MGANTRGKEPSMFKFTIREAILMTTIVAVCLMWWLERTQNTKNDARLTAIETRLQMLPVTVLPPTKIVVSAVPAGPTVVPPPYPSTGQTSTAVPGSTRRLVERIRNGAETYDREIIVPAD